MVELKITIQNRSLSETDQDWILQRVATAYVPDRRDEYRIYAPAKATGDALEWVDHLIVRKKNSGGGEFEVTDGNRLIVIRAVKVELERQHHDETRPIGMHPDGVHYIAHICLGGHVLSSGRMAFPSGEHCSKCGSASIHACQACKAPIRGIHIHAAIPAYQRPSFCYKCGHPYPWMRDRLETARELLYHDDKLTIDDRNKLWDSLQYVMSDPKSDLVPAKKKLIEINLEKAGKATREFVLDLMAKIAAETLKG